MSEWTEPKRCPRCDEPTSLCQCEEAMTTPTPLPHAVAIQMCSDFDEASYRCGDPNHSPISCTCMKLVMTWRTMQRDLAAAQEENAKLKAHAEAMASAAQSIPENIEGWCEPLSDAVYAYRRDFPKDAP